MTRYMNDYLHVHVQVGLWLKSLNEMKVLLSHAQQIVGLGLIVGHHALRCYWMFWFYSWMFYSWRWGCVALC